jgi:hypothetical protein
LTSDKPLREETDDPLVADRRKFFKVELWTRDGRHVERLLFAGNSLDKARALFAAYGKRRPRARLTIRQRTGSWLSGLNERNQAPTDCSACSLANSSMFAGGQPGTSMPRCKPMFKSTSLISLSDLRPKFGVRSISASVFCTRKLW